MLQFLTKGLISLFAIARLFFCLNIGEFGLTVKKISKLLQLYLFVEFYTQLQTIQNFWVIKNCKVSAFHISSETW